MPQGYIGLLLEIHCSFLNGKTLKHPARQKTALKPHIELFLQLCAGVGQQISVLTI